MRILVTGGDGQLGRAFADVEPPRGWILRRLGRHQLDVTKEAEILRVLGDEHWDLVVNTAAYTRVDAAEGERETAYAVNLDGAALLADACAVHEVALVHISTDYVFDGARRRPYREDDAPGLPVNFYGASKLAGEQAIRARWDHHVILRTSWLFSASAESFIGKILAAIRTRPVVSVVDDQIGCPTAAADLAGCVLKLAAAAGAHRPGCFGTFHFCGREPTTWYGFARAVLDAAPPALAGGTTLRPVTSAEHGAPARRPGYSVLDCTRIRTVFEIEQPDWRARVRDYVPRLTETIGSADFDA